jgi:hypothetical protein
MGKLSTGKESFVTTATTWCKRMRRDGRLIANIFCHIAPKKKEQQKMSLGAFLTDESKSPRQPRLPFDRN